MLNRGRRARHNSKMLRLALVAYYTQPPRTKHRSTANTNTNTNTNTWVEAEIVVVVMKKKWTWGGGGGIYDVKLGTDGGGSGIRGE